MPLSKHLALQIRRVVKETVTLVLHVSVEHIVTETGETISHKMSNNSGVDQCVLLLQ